MPIKAPPHHVWLVACLAITGIVMTLLWHMVGGVNQGVLADIPRHYEIPPTFGGSRMFYGLVLALMMTADALAFGAMIDNIRFLLTNDGAWREPAKVTVVNETVLLLAVLFSTVPDVLVLLSWGELMAPPYAFLSKMDRTFDGIAALTFVVYAYRRIRTRPVLMFQLQRQPVRIDLEPTWHQLRPKLSIAFVVALISFGVAFAK